MTNLPKGVIKEVPDSKTIGLAAIAEEDTHPSLHASPASQISASGSGGSDRSESDFRVFPTRFTDSIADARSHLNQSDTPNYTQRHMPLVVAHLWPTVDP